MFRITAVQCVAFTRWLACLVPVLASVGSAQELRGTVLREDGRGPASGVVLVLLDSASGGQIVARSVTGARGSFALTAPANGAMTLRVLRVGYEAMTIGTYRLAAGETRDVRVRLDERRVNLAAIEVKGGSSCDTRSGGAQIVQLFTQAQTALLSTMSTISGVRGEADIVNFVRNETRNGTLDGDIERVVMTGEAARPYASAPAAELERNGYAQEAEDGTVLFAPDADVLLSTSFVNTHCFSLVEPEDKNPGVVGIGFRPAVPSDKKVDVRGTLWLNRKSADLLYLEYGYEPLHLNYRRLRIGGRVGYRKTPGGAWFVSEWSIRTPRIYGRRLRAPNDPLPGDRGLLGVQTVGGEVLALRFNDELQYHNEEAWRAGSLSADVLNVRITKSSIDLGVRQDTLVIDVDVESAGSLKGGAITPEFAMPEVLPTDRRKSALYVRTALGRPVAYATVSVKGGTAVVTDTTGRVVLSLDDDNVHVTVRSLGFVAFQGTLARKSKSEPFRVTLNQNAQALAKFEVIGKRTKSPLELNGFYRRMTDVQRGAIVGEFFTPEMVELRMTASVADFLRASKHITVVRDREGAILMSNRPSAKLGGTPCEMSIVLDGIPVHGDNGINSYVHIDRLVNGNEVAAIEVYRSSTFAPVELLPHRPDTGTCGIVAIWTGGRR